MKKDLLKNEQKVLIYNMKRQVITLQYIIHTIHYNNINIIDFYFQLNEISEWLLSNKLSLIV